ncbi:MAG: CopD family protein [Cytophagales bacterium]|nr:CopD family protein [Cytophagales bacterium]
MEEIILFLSSYAEYFMTYKSYFKGLHIVFFVCWFAGLFYTVRLFIYQTQAQQYEEPRKGILTEQYKIMARRLWYIISWPAGILTLLSGLSMLPFSWMHPWMHAKLFLVLLLCFYHMICHQKLVQLKRDEYRWGVFSLRLFNEVATLLLFAIVLLAVVKDISKGMQAFLWLIVLGVVLFLAIGKFHRANRNEKNKTTDEGEEKLINPSDEPENTDAKGNNPN